MTPPTKRIYRPTKLAQGMSETYDRSKKSRGYQLHHKGDKRDVLMLLVRGTCDPLGTSMRTISKSRCPCCNGTGRSGYELSVSGQLRLRKLRRKRGL